MATWTTIPDSSLEPGKPIRSIDTLALRDNPVAIAEGAPGAPRLSDAALGITATTAGSDWINARLRSYDVWSRNAVASVGELGTYAFLGETSITTTLPGATRAGSALRYAGILASSPWSTTYQAVGGGVGTTTTPTGTWRCMGMSYGFNGIGGDPDGYGATLWLRIA